MYGVPTWTLDTLAMNGCLRDVVCDIYPASMSISLSLLHASNFYEMHEMNCHLVNPNTLLQRNDVKKHEHYILAPSL